MLSWEDLEKQFAEIFGNDIKCLKNSFRNEISFITEKDFENNIKNQLAKFNNVKIKTIHTML